LEAMHVPLLASSNPSISFTGDAGIALTYNLPATERWRCALRHSQFRRQKSKCSYFGNRYFHDCGLLVSCHPEDHTKPYFHTRHLLIDVYQSLKKLSKNKNIDLVRGPGR